MDKTEIGLQFFWRIIYRKLLTQFLIQVFDYHELTDSNYIYRIKGSADEIILDIYDNVSMHRFNRYIFSFGSFAKEFQISEKDGVFVTVIRVLNSDGQSPNKLIKLAHLFSLEKSEMLKFAQTFLNEEFVEILRRIIK